MNYFDVAEWPRRVVFGPGSVGELGALAAQIGVARALVVCGSTVAGGEMLERVRGGLGTACAGVFDKIEAQNPLPCVRAGADMARELDADVIVSVGGGSAIDAGKCIVMLLGSAGELDPYLIEEDARDTTARRALGVDVLAHIAVPTTTGSSSEAMPTAGCLDTEQGRKLLLWDSALVPGVVVLDPEMAVFASPELTARSGMTAVARCIEALYSGKRQPIATGLALQGMRLLRRSLPRSVARPGDLAARGECQIGCLMSGVAAINAMASVVHGVGHILGGGFGLQHGVGHAILLPAAMRLLLPAIGTDQYEVLEAVGGRGNGLSGNEAGELAARSIEALVADLPMPRRLRDTGIGEADLSGIANAAMGDYMMINAPRPVTEAELLSLLHTTW